MTSSLFYIIGPIVIPICLFAFLALPYIADHYQNRQNRRAADGRHGTGEHPSGEPSSEQPVQTGGSDLYPDRQR
jgi:hypothetical protein